MNRCSGSSIIGVSSNQMSTAGGLNQVQVDVTYIVNTIIGAKITLLVVHTAVVKDFM